MVTLVDELMNELHIDATDEETTTLKALINEAQAIVDSAIGVSDPAVNSVADDAIYVRTVKTLATQMYYDRSLEAGMSKGLIMMLEYLELKKVNVDGAKQ